MSLIHSPSTLLSFRFGRRPVLLLALACLPLLQGKADTPVINVFLLGGQSNMDGRALISDLPSALQAPQPDVPFYHDTILTTLRPQSGGTGQFGPEVTFGKDMAAYFEAAGSSIAIIKYAAGGTNLYSQWAAGGTATQTGDGTQYVSFQNTVARGLQALRTANPTAIIQISGMIWMQGESDAVVVNGVDESLVYQANLTNFIKDVRMTYGANLPFVIGRLSVNQTGTGPAAQRGNVITAQNAVTASLPRVGIVNTDSFSLKSDNLHFDATGQQDLGSGFATAMQSTAASPIYIGDDAVEGASPTAGTGQDTLSTPVTYGFVTTGTTYANTTSYMQQVTLTQVNFYAGSVSGTITPFAAIYTGNQSVSNIQQAINYNVVVIGDPISTTGGSGRQQQAFLAHGVSPVVTLAPGQVLSVGYVASAGGVARYGAGVGTIDYVALANTVPAIQPAPFTASTGMSLDRTLKFNVGIVVRVAPVLYIGDDAVEGTSVTSGTAQDSLTTPVTYAFAASSTTYVNTTDFVQYVTLSQVNFYAGSYSGTVTPFAAVYLGDQGSTSIKTGANYEVVTAGDVLSVTGGSGVQNRAFTVGGVNPVFELEPGEILAVGYLASRGGVVRYGAGTGIIDYVALVDTLPASPPAPLTASTGMSLDRTLKFNVGISVNSGPFYLGDDAAEGAAITNGTGQDSLSTAVTYGFVASGTTYANPSSGVRKIVPGNVNFYAGSVTGTLTPFLALYTGDQSATAIKSAANYRIVSIGDSIQVVGNSGLQSYPFVVNGYTPSLFLRSGQVLTAGYLASAGGVVRYGAGTGVIDYVTLAGTLPATVGNPFSASASTALDRTLKFNIGYNISTGPFKVACIGDSITYGAFLQDPSTQSYPPQLQALLGNDFIVTNYGVSGRTMLKNGDSPYWNTGQYPQSIGSNPDIVVMMLGTNDSKPQNWVYQSEFLSDYKDMIQSYRATNSHPMILVNTCPTVAGPDTGAITNSIVTGQIVPLVRQAAADMECPIADVNTGTANIPLDFPDNVHPNIAGAGAIASMVASAIVGPQAPTSGTTYQLIGKYCGLPVEVANGSTSAGAVVDVATNSGSAGQKWVLTALSGGYWKITNLNSGLALDVAGGSTLNGAGIVQSTYTGATSQQWLIVDVGQGYSHIVNRASGLLLEVPGGNAASGAAVHQVSLSTTDDGELFQLIPR
ncbi:MAG TPA: sialate O-acetylesterase [Rariglobus sp.]|jgi:lysophospholipase L1-like esterase|nr:sialate O-acetylesterase [Rariglobus sp.]